MKTQDKFQNVTDAIVARIEAGKAPWYPRFSKDIFSKNMRPLRSTGQPYRGINRLSIWLRTFDSGFNSEYWFTYRQAAELNGQVRKGETSVPILYYGQVLGEDDRVEAFTKWYCVFNAEQCDNLPKEFSIPPANVSKKANHKAFEDLVAATKATIRTGGDGSYYHPPLDFIQMSHRQGFKDNEHYLATLAHEMIHWAGNKLQWPNHNLSDDDIYCKEELAAEIGAAFLCADMGITARPLKIHAAYLKRYLDIMQRDKRAIFKEAARAQKAIDYIYKVAGYDNAGIAVKPAK